MYIKRNQATTVAEVVELNTGMEVLLLRPPERKGRRKAGI